ncbi:MAG: chemotaxis response regulator protein-glutamate methylesterase [Desulfuromonadaceae bacterium GWB2_53_15]|nr:MAG: chemotaxis response regulator protein-glutamate methylesterase [Desulfuromonadaceae bacterium GWB2_53_15]
MKKVRVLVVDDSAFSRRSISKMLEEMSEIEVVGYATNGEEGIQKVIALKPDLVTVDLEMPKMDGFTLLRILTTRFSMPVIVISALSGADKVFKALELGALDFIAKPSSTASIELLQIQGDLQQKVLQIVNLKKNSVRRRYPHPSLEQTEQHESAHYGGDNVRLLQHPIDIVAIGASTGGPPALQNIFSSFEKKYPFAVVVSQHMPAGFTRAFAERLNRSSQFEVKEAEDGDHVLHGKILIAPGGFNLVLEVNAGQVVVRIVSPTQADRYVPSVDVMLESCASIYRKRMIAVILTGMGNDGSKGVRSVKEQGGYIIAESDQTAVVYGMPREAVATGLVDRVVPLQRVAREILLKGSFV